MKRILVAAIAALATTAATSVAFAGPAFVCTMANPQNSDRMEMTFVVTDAAAGKGLVIGNAGTANLRFMPGNHGLNFFEFTPAGNVMLATIVLPDTLPVTLPSSPAKYPIVYSRHTVMDIPVNGKMEGELLPSQFRGECTLKN